MANKILYKVFSFLVDAEGEVFNKKFDLDKNVSLVRGILLSSNKPNMLFYRGSQRIEISGDEIFPEEHESKLLMTGMSVSPDGKFLTLGDGAVAGNGVLKIQYRDEINPNAVFTAYKVIIVLLCEMK